jgi:hypothetical protein
MRARDQIANNFGEILSFFHRDFEKEISCTGLAPSLIIMYYKYNIAYCNKMKLEECHMKENKKETEVITNPYFERKKQYI